MGCMRVAVKNVNELSVCAQLVCSIGPEVWEYFNVTDGPLMVDEGFFKVYKSE